MMLRLLDLWFLLLGIAATAAAINGAFNTHGIGRTFALGLVAAIFAGFTLWAGRSIARGWI